MNVVVAKPAVISAAVSVTVCVKVCVPTTAVKTTLSPATAPLLNAPFTVKVLAPASSAELTNWLLSASVTMVTTGAMPALGAPLSTT